jgi:hypothetical protein
MSKFLKLCAKVERFIVEQDDPNMANATQSLGGVPADPTANVSPGEPVPPTDQKIDPKTGSDIQEVSNEKIEKLIQGIVNFYQKGQALPTDKVNEIKDLPSKVNAENSEKTVDSLIAIFDSSDFPEESETFES